MQISALKTLVAISRIGSFSRAAELQNMTLSGAEHANQGA